MIDNTEYDALKDFRRPNAVVLAYNRVFETLIWPMAQIEKKIDAEGEFNRRYGEPGRKASAAAHLERWIILAFGLMTSHVSSIYFGSMSASVFIPTIILSAWTMAMFFDPFVWARTATRKSGESMSFFDFRRKDWAVSVVVNLTCIYLYALGFLVGSVV
jgi:hypothetical protein